MAYLAHLPRDPCLVSGDPHVPADLRRWLSCPRVTIVVRGLGCQESLKERPVALEGGAKVVGGDLVAPIPVALQPPTLISKGSGQVLHDLGDQLIGLLDRLAWRVHEPGLDIGPTGPKALGVVGGQQGAGRGGVGRARIGGHRGRGLPDGCSGRLSVPRPLDGAVLLLQPIPASFGVKGTIGGRVLSPRRGWPQVIARQIIRRTVMAALAVGVVGAIGSCRIWWLLAGKIGGAQVLAALTHHRASSLRPSSRTSNNSANSDR